MATKKDGSPLPVEYDGIGRCGIRSIKRNPKIDEEVIKKVNLYEKNRYTSKFDLQYYNDTIPKNTNSGRVNLLGTRKPSLISPIASPPKENKMTKIPFILNNSSSTNLMDVEVDNMSSLNQNIIRDLRQRHSVQSLGSHRLPAHEYQDMPKKDLIKIIN